jgi:hypothetical protein
MTLAKELPHAPQWSWLRFRCQFPIVRRPRGVTLAIVDGAANPQPIQCQPDRSHTMASNTRAIVAIVLLTAGWLAHLRILKFSRRLVHHQNFLLQNHLLATEHCHTVPPPSSTASHYLLSFTTPIFPYQFTNHKSQWHPERPPPERPSPKSLSTLALARTPGVPSRNVLPPSTPPTSVSSLLPASPLGLPLSPSPVLKAST